MIKVKRVYEPPERDDGKRFLVERLWPRGVKKDALPLTAWLKEVAPSTTLRKWYAHDVTRWPEFRSRYRAELKEMEQGDEPNALATLLQAAREGNLTLLYSARDTDHNSALVLRDFLEERLRRG